MSAKPGPQRADPTNVHRIFTAEDARRLARRRLPRMIFDFIDGAAGSESAPERNHQAFRDTTLQPRVLLDVEHRDLSTRFLGNDYALPFGIAPMGMCQLAHPDADALLAQASVERNIPVCLSSAASMSIEEMKQRAGGNAWFQLYAGRSAPQTMSMVERAAQAGYRTLVLTVDVPQISRRIRDLKNGFQVPFRIGPRQFLDFALHPRWSLSMLRAGVPRPVNFDATDGSNNFDRHNARVGANWAFLDRLRSLWPGCLIVKGVTHADDATRIRDAGADAVWVSNHGGRQLDGAPATLDVLPGIRAAVGTDFPLVFDSGVRCGEDVVKALAMGADFVMLGRPALFALGAGGRTGLNDLLDELAADISVAMAQIGVCACADVTHECLVAPPEVLDLMLSGKTRKIQVVEPKLGLKT